MWGHKPINVGKCIYTHLYLCVTLHLNLIYIQQPWKNTVVSDVCGVGVGKKYRFRPSSPSNSISNQQI